MKNKGCCFINGPNLFQMFSRYSISGIFATTIHYIIFFIMIHLFFWVPWHATLLSASAGAVAAYFLNYRFTFKSAKGHLGVLPKFLIVSVLVVVYQALIVAILCHYFHYLIAQLFATSLGLIVSFILNKSWTFY